eukprot:219764_1
MTAKINDGQEIVLFPAGTIIKRSYKFGVSLNITDDQIQILSITKKCDKDNDDYKCSNCDKLQRQITKAKYWNEEIVNSLQQRINQLEKSNNEKKDINDELNVDNTQKLALINELQQKITIIENEKAEFEQKHENVKATNIKLNE